MAFSVGFVGELLPTIPMKRGLAGFLMVGGDGAAVSVLGLGAAVAGFADLNGMARVRNKNCLSMT